VDVTAEWSVSELELNPRRDLVDRYVVTQILTDPPELLALPLVVDPAAARGLEEWMYQEQEESSPGREHAGDLCDGRLKRVHIF
jgi:hypothetical protein